MKRLRGFSAQLLLFVVLPLFLLLSGIALGSVLVHQRSMRALVGERDLRAVRVAAAAISTPDGLQSDEHLRSVLVELEASPGTEVMLVDAEGRIVYDTSPQRVGQASSHPGAVEALAGRSGLLYRTDQPGGQEHVVAYAPVPSSPGNGGEPRWALVVEEPWAKVLSPWLRTSLMGPLILVPAVAVALVALWLAVQRVIRPLQQLDARVEALGEGDFAAVQAPIGGITEIQELQSALARMAAQIQNYQQSMRTYLGVVTAAQEDERRRLARELHDQTIQDLIALKQRVQVARRKAAHEPEALPPLLADLQAMLDTTMEEVRRLSRALRPIYLEEAGLAAALEALVHDAEQDTPQVALDVEGHVRRAAPEVELALYRIVQEAVHNAVRHAQASKIWVTLEYGEDVSVRVQDDGIGFVPPPRVSDLAMKGHYGLMGMQERAQLVGAELDVDSQPQAGTVVAAHWRPNKRAVEAESEDSPARSQR